MEHQKVLNLLNESNNSKFVTRKWNISNDQSNANYNVGNEIIYNTVRSNLCDYHDAYISVKVILLSQQLLQYKYHLKIVHHLLNVSQKLMEQGLDLVNANVQFNRI